ncbi:MAG: hypothetical protein ABWX92_13130 [Mycetocola sp.]
MPIVEADEGFEDRHVFFDADAHPDYRESLAYLLPLPQLGLGIIYYTWVHSLGENGQGRAGSMMVVYGPGVPEPIFEVVDRVFIPDSMTLQDWEVGPAKMRLDHDMMGGRLRFDSDVLQLDVEFVGLNPSFGFMANRNGCPAWLASDRAEQSVRYSGSLRVGEGTHAIDDYGHRDHSWGNRDWGGATHWKWWNIIGDEGIAIHVMELQAFGTTTLHGYVQKDGQIAAVLTLDPDITFDDRFMQTDIAATITDDEGRTTQIHTWYGADLAWPVSEFLTLHEASMFATIDGKPGRAYMEIAWPPAYADHHRRVGSALRGTDSQLTINRG